MNKSPKNIQTMFNSIAKNYDKLNNIISFGMHKSIKSSCVKLLKINSKDNILDLCTGTGDFIGILKNYKVIGLDFSSDMLKIAQEKYKTTKFIQGDCTYLPFEDNSFDIITLGFGLRNIENRNKAIQEIYRVLKLNGQFLHLDFGEKNFIGNIFETITPFIASIFTQNKSAYKYLIESKQSFPEPQQLIEEFLKENFKLTIRKDFLFHSISCQIFTK